MASEDLKRAVDSYDKYIGRKGVDEAVIDAYLEACKTAILVEKDKTYGLMLTGKCKGLIDNLIWTSAGGTFWQLENYAQRHDERYTLLDKGYEIYKLESFHKFESYMYYMEKRRPQEKRFYLPRKRTLHVVAEDIQDLVDDKLDVLGESMPSRTGKSTICIFGMTWVGLKFPQSHSAMGGHSGQLAKRFFKGYDNLVSTPEYTFDELFQTWHPGLKTVANKSSDPAEFTINLGSDDEFSTISCRGIDGTWTGAIDVSRDGILYVDDLVRDRQHSLSAARMEETYQEYQNKMLDRMNDGAKLMLVGTLWSVNDPIERERILREGNPRARFRRIPALDEETDESNFRYLFGLGFSTKYYRAQRDRLEKAEWMAKFQQKPFVREGLVLPIEELQTFTEIEGEVLRTYARCDPAFGGGDSLSMPIIKDCGDVKYVIDWIHDKRTPAFTVPRIVDKISRHGVSLLTIEKNAGGELLAEKIQNEMKARGVNHCKIELKSAPVKLSKEDKIVGYSDYIKSHYRFIAPRECGDYLMSEDYRRAIDEATTYTSEGKNLHDDAIDVLAQSAMDEDESTRTRASKARIIKSPI